VCVVITLVTDELSSLSLSPTISCIVQYCIVLYCTIFYYFLERTVLQRLEDQTKQALLHSEACSREELQHELIVQMKSVTGAGDEECGSTLENNGYDLKTSIEAFYIQR
jgi:hypothetical protein